MDNELASLGKTTSSPFIRAQQMKHFIVMDILPHIAAFAAVLLLSVFPFGLPEIGVLVAMWALTGLGGIVNLTIPSAHPISLLSRDSETI